MPTTPYTAYHFQLEVSGLALQAGFTEVSGLDVELERLEYRTGDEIGSARTVVGLTRYADVVLARGMADLELFTWMERSRRHAADAERDALIRLLDPETHDPVLRWELHAARPVALHGPVLRADTTSVAVERLVLAHRGFELETG